MPEATFLCRYWNPVLPIHEEATAYYTIQCKVVLQNEELFNFCSLPNVTGVKRKSASETCSLSECIPHY